MDGLVASLQTTIRLGCRSGPVSDVGTEAGSSSSGGVGEKFFFLEALLFRGRGVLVAELEAEVEASISAVLALRAAVSALVFRMASRFRRMESWS
jgi:hypothetical protein